MQRVLCPVLCATRLRNQIDHKQPQGRSQGGSWDARDPPFLGEQPTTGDEDDMTIWSVPSLWHSVPPPPPFEKSWLRPWTHRV